MRSWLAARIALILIFPTSVAGCVEGEAYDESRAPAEQGEAERAESPFESGGATTRVACLHTELLFRALHPEEGSGFPRGDYEITVEVDRARTRSFLCSLQAVGFSCSDIEDGLGDGESVSVTFVPLVRALDSTAKFLVLYASGSEIPVEVRTTITSGGLTLSDVTVIQEETTLDPCQEDRARYVTSAETSLDGSGADPVEISI